MRTCHWRRRLSATSLEFHRARRWRPLSLVLLLFFLVVPLLLLLLLHQWPQRLEASHGGLAAQPLLRRLDVISSAGEQRHCLKHQPLQLLYAVPEEQRAAAGRRTERSGVLWAHGHAWRGAAGDGRQPQVGAAHLAAGRWRRCVHALLLWVRQWQWQ
jgi:hypothetical protein